MTIIRIAVFFLFATYMTAIRADLLDVYDDTKKPEKTEGEAGQSQPPTKTENKKSEPVEKDSNKKKKKNRAKSQTADSKKQPIHFQGLGLSGIRDKGFIELHKNVVVVQGDFRLESENAKIFFEEKSDQVKRVFAEGNVRIHKIDAETGKVINSTSKTAEFEADEQVVTLKGDAKLLKGDDVITGDYILYNLKTGWIKAEKVKGVVNPRN
jgi:lipopolysaccharide transport protein LptA